MPSLKDLKTRINSVKSTQKITKAMKMVAASKLRRAREQAEAARPYSLAMERMLSSLAAGMAEGANVPRLMSGTGNNQTQLIIVATADRGLCGAFNSSIVRSVRRRVRELEAEGKTVKLICVGRKGYEQLRHEFGKKIISRSAVSKERRLSYSDAERVSQEVMQRFEAGEFDTCHIVYNEFKSAIAQVVTYQQIIPFQLPEKDKAAASEPGAVYEYEPEEGEILIDLLPRNLGVQIYRALMENAASFYGSQMTAMDNATRNAGEMIKKLNLRYNRTRQAAITKELIEIISGADAV